MSGASVCVLALNGRRQTVKCTPNTTILQILEEVCKKQGLQPEEYDLKHHNKVLDTTMIFRFSGLPNNAQLELAPVLKLRSEGDITLAINLENGNRVIGNFKPNDTLLNILNKLCPESITQDKYPVLIYTRREIHGKELENVTLRSLGLTGGRAMLRLIHRLPEELKTQANVSAPLPSKPAQEQPYIRKRVPTPPIKMEPSLAPPNNNQTDVMTQERKEDPPKSSKPQKSSTVDYLKLAREKRKSNDISSNEEKRKSTETQLGKIVKKSDVCCCNTVEQMEMNCSGKCEVKCPNIAQQSEEGSIEDDFVFLGERNAMLFSLETARAVPSEDLPDDFFELTIDDARKILRDVKKQKLGMDNMPLMTAALRKLEASKKQLRQLQKYKKAIIRVQFPDRTVLQGIFSPMERIADIIKFVREYLEDKSLNFYVYSTPPKCILEEKKRLIELGFVPGALVHFGVHSNSENSKSFLRKDLRNKFTSNSVASLAASRMRKLPLPNEVLLRFCRGPRTKFIDQVKFDNHSKTRKNYFTSQKHLHLFKSAAVHMLARTENTRLCPGPQQEDPDLDMEEDSSSQVAIPGPSTSSGITHENYERKIIRSTEKVPKWFKP